MRRYGQDETRVTVPGVNAGLKLTLQPSVVAAVPCKPAPTGLFWFSDLTGEFSESAEAAYLIDAGAAGPVLGVARVLGETCGEVVWEHVWTPAVGENGGPGLAEEGSALIVYPRADTRPGILEISARCAGRSLGPILLTLLPLSCCPDPVALLPQAAPFEIVMTADKELYFLSFGQTGTAGVEISVDWSATYTGTDPGSIALYPNGLTCLLVLDRNFGDQTTVVTVSAHLVFACGGHAREQTVTWDFAQSFG